MTESNDESNFDFSRARKALLSWFDANERRFPWRDEPTPYRVWISEIMLQQTTTQTVLGYFERFLARFPNPSALAAASEEEVLKFWEGLGYYRRAKMAREAAREIVARFDGEFPSRFEDVLSLPGIGRYAAGAILSFGFDERFAILEANTTRLHARLLGLRSETTSAESQRILWRFAESWLPRESSRRPAGIYRRINGALTDLGRLICPPKDPSCERCPLAKFCESERLSLQSIVPVLKKKADPIRRTDVALWIAREDLPGAKNVFDLPGAERSPTDVLLIRRAAGSLWAGLWDFPRFEVGDASVSRDFSSDAFLADRLQFFLEEEAGAPASDYRVGASLATITHAVTKYRVTLHLCQTTSARTNRAPKKERTLFEFKESPTNPNANRGKSTRPCARIASETRWVPIDKLRELPLSSPGRRIAELIAKLASER